MTEEEATELLRRRIDDPPMERTQEENEQEAARQAAARAKGWRNILLGAIHIPTADWVPENMKRAAELATRMQEHGLSEPLLVRERRGGQYGIEYELVDVADRHLRTAACILGWRTIPAIIDRQERL